MFESGLTVVVSPLLALMKDQMDSLRAKGIAADMIGSNLTVEEKFATKDRVRGGLTKILFLSPEQLVNEGTRALILSRTIALLAIDEVHCISGERIFFVFAL
jgi:ATP-dependent DNA helicase RecQ